MKIANFQKFSLIEYPGKISCIIFTQGCNFNCLYCHNPELIPTNTEKLIPEEEILKFLEKRKNQIDAVVITGGEPTLQPDLIDFLKKLKNMNFLLKLETNGSKPEIIKKILEYKLLDFITMDIKSPPEKYETITKTKIDFSIINESIEIIKNSKIPFEFRTTLLEKIIDEKDIEKIKKLFPNLNLTINNAILKNRLKKLKP